MKSNQDVHRAGRETMFWGADNAAYGAVGDAMYDAVYLAVDWPVTRAVYDVVNWTTGLATCKDPPHPSLRAFLAVTITEAP